MPEASLVSCPLRSELFSRRALEPRLRSPDPPRTRPVWGLRKRAGPQLLTWSHRPQRSPVCRSLSQPHGKLGPQTRFSVNHTPLLVPAPRQELEKTGGVSQGNFIERKHGHTQQTCFPSHSASLSLSLSHTHTHSSPASATQSTSQPQGWDTPQFLRSRGSRGRKDSRGRRK